MRVIVRGHAHDCTAGTAAWTPELNVFWLPRFRPIYCGRQLLRRCRLQRWRWRRFRRRSRCRCGGWFRRRGWSRCRFRRRGRCGSWCRLGRGSRLGGGNARAADQHRRQHRQRHRYGNSHKQDEARSAPSSNIFNIFNKSHRSHMSHKRNTRGSRYFTGATTRRPL